MHTLICNVNFNKKERIKIGKDKKSNIEDIFEEEKMKIDTVIYNLIVLKMRNDFLTHIFKVITNFRWSIYFNWSIYIVNNINKK